MKKTVNGVLRFAHLGKRQDLTEWHTLRFLNLLNDWQHYFILEIKLLQNRFVRLFTENRSNKMTYVEKVDVFCYKAHFPNISIDYFANFTVNNPQSSLNSGIK